MEQPQQRSKSMVFVLVVSAILLAVATFLTIILITSRGSSTGTSTITPNPILQPQTSVIEVNGVLITITTDPNKTYFLAGESNTGPIENPSPEPPQINPTEIPQPTPLPTIVPTITPRPDPIIFIDYTVVQGDTLYSIADAQNSSVELMARYGHDANDLTPGNVIRGLPIANPAYCQGSRAYVVRDLDTVFRIAAEFNTTVEAIAQLNNLDQNYRIDMAQVICIPV